MFYWLFWITVSCVWCTIGTVIAREFYVRVRKHVIDSVKPRKYSSYRVEYGYHGRVSPVIFWERDRRTAYSILSWFIVIFWPTMFIVAIGFMVHKFIFREGKTSQLSQWERREGVKEKIAELEQDLNMKVKEVAQISSPSDDLIQMVKDHKLMMEKLKMDLSKK